MGRFPASKKSLAEAQNYVCPWCNLPLPEDLAETDRDHIIPRSRGGPNEPWNRQLLHKACNRGEGGKGSQLTAEAEALAAKYNIILHEPLPRSWPGSTVALGSGKPNPYRVARENGTDLSKPKIALPSGTMRAALCALRAAEMEVDSEAVRVIIRGILPSVERHVRRELAKSEPGQRTLDDTKNRRPAA